MTLAVVLVLLGGLAGCGSSGPPYQYSTQQRAAVQSDCERAVREVGKEGLVGVAEHAAEECQCYMPLRETKAPATKSIAAGDVLSDPACVFNEHSGEREHTSEESEHTPEENARHRRSLESQKQAHEEVERSLEKDKPQIEQAHREADKACYETGRTEAECNGPEHQRQEERANAENRQRQIENGELQVHE